MRCVARSSSKNLGMLGGVELLEQCCFLLSALSFSQDSGAICIPIQYRCQLCLRWAAIISVRLLRVIVSHLPAIE